MLNIITAVDLFLTAVSLNVPSNDLYLKEMRRTGRDQVTLLLVNNNNEGRVNAPYSVRLSTKTVPLKPESYTNVKQAYFKILSPLSQKK